jgi:hypothetical protein
MDYGYEVHREGRKLERVIGKISPSMDGFNLDSFFSESNSVRLFEMNG